MAHVDGRDVQRVGPDVRSVGGSSSDDGLQRALAGAAVFVVRRAPGSDRRSLEVSDGIRRFGYDPDAVRDGSPDYVDLVHPDDRPEVMTGIERFLADGAQATHTSIYRLRTASGAIARVAEHTCAERAEDSTITALLSVVIDITAYTGFPSAPTTTEAQHRALLDALPFYVARIDRSGRLTFVNRHMADAYGRSPRQLMGRTTFDLHAPEVAAANAAADEAAMRSGRTSVARTRNDERGTLHEVIRVPIRDAGGTVDGLCLVSIDRSLEASHLALLDALPFDVARVDLEGRLTFANRHLADAYGFEPSKMVGRTAFDLHPHEVAAAIAAADSAAMRRGEISRTMIENDERETYYDVIRVPIRNASGAVDGLQIVAIDQTDETRARRALEASETRYRQLFESSLSGFALHEVITDEDGQPVDLRFLEANPAWERMTGLRRDDVLGRTVREVTPSSESFWIERYGAVGLSGVPDQFTGYAAALGRHHEVYAYRNAPGQVAVLVHDITERRAQEIERQRLSLAVEQGPSLVFITDPDGTVQYVNQRYVDVSGFARSELVGRASDLLGAATRTSPTHVEMWQALQAGEHWTGTHEARTKDGRAYWISVRVAPVTGQDGSLEHYVALAEDVTEQRRLSERVDFLAYHDELTGLPNRTLFIDRMQQALLVARRGRRPVALLVVGIDDFTAINVAFGHAGGDHVIVTVAERIAASVRAGDTVARFTGDQFLVLLTGLAHEDDLVLVIEAITSAVLAPIVVDGHDSAVVNVSVSIGAATHDPGDGTLDPGELLANAEVALARAKSQGRGHHRVFSQSLDTEVADRIRLEHDLHRAIEQRELLLEYQPRVDITSGALVSLEALVRWDHPVQGRLPPGRFVPAAERSRAILALGAEVRRQAIGQLDAWRLAGVPLVPIAVNVSGIELVSGDVLTSLREHLDAFGIEPTWLEVEVTESTAMSSDPTVLRQLEGLQALGIRIAVDDFGTAYSSLSRLKVLPVSTLKIDRSLLSDLTPPIADDGRDAAVIRAVLGLGEALGLEVIAEGVEREDQAAFLRRHGCRFAQGYLFARPLSTRDIEARLRALRQEA